MQTKKVLFFLLLICITGFISAFLHIFMYSDIKAFYETFASKPGLPYIDKFSAYPVLTGLFVHFMGVLGRNVSGYYALSALFLTLFAAIATYFLYRSNKRKDRERLLFYWILAPSMFFMLISNWDIIAIMFVAIALFCIRQDKDRLASLFLALAFCAKFYPALYLLPLLLRKKNMGEGAKLIGIFGATALAINLYFMVANLDGWSDFFTFNSTREPNMDSIWGIIHYGASQIDVNLVFPVHNDLVHGLVSSLVAQFSTSVISRLSTLLFLSLTAITIWKLRRESTIKVCFMITLIFLLTNKVFSPQYELWLLPFFVLLPLTTGKGIFYALEASGIMAGLAILGWYFGLPEFQNTYLHMSQFFVIIRHLILIYVFIRAFDMGPRIPLPRRSGTIPQILAPQVT